MSLVLSCYLFLFHCTNLVYNKMQYFMWQLTVCNDMLWMSLHVACHCLSLNGMQWHNMSLHGILWHMKLHAVKFHVQWHNMSLHGMQWHATCTSLYAMRWRACHMSLLVTARHTVTCNDMIVTSCQSGVYSNMHVKLLGTLNHRSHRISDNCYSWKNWQLSLMFFINP